MSSVHINDINRMYYVTRDSYVKMNLLTYEDEHLVLFSESHVDERMTDVEEAINGDGAQRQQRLRGQHDCSHSERRAEARRGNDGGRAGPSRCAAVLLLGGTGVSDMDPEKQ